MGACCFTTVAIASGRRVNSAAPHDLAGIVDDTERSFLQGYIKADILVALGHGLAALVLQGPARYQSRDYVMSGPAVLQSRRAQEVSRAGRRTNLSTPPAPARPTLIAPSTAARSMRSE
jgi:hypothetical protein